MQSLEALGWTVFFSKQRCHEARLVPARVCGGVPPAVLVHDGRVERPALVPGRAHDGGIVVGDWVLVDRGQDPWTVFTVLERSSALVRAAAGRATAAQTLAANVDLVLVLDSLERPLSPRRLERLVAFSWGCGIEPVILLTKADLHPDPGAALRDATAVAPGVAVHAVVSTDGSTAELVRTMLWPGRTAVLVGLSGVGKSTLANCLLGRLAARTGEVRSSDGRGRHTTTIRCLFPVPGGGALIDGPGIRELALWAGEEGVERTFVEIAALAESCRFRDCQHGGEPGCAVTAAVESGRLDPDRLASYLKLQRELEVSRLRREGALRAEERRRWRPIHRAMRRFEKG